MTSRRNKRATEGKQSEAERSNADNRKTSAERSVEKLAARSRTSPHLDTTFREALIHFRLSVPETRWIYTDVIYRVVSSFIRAQSSARIVLRAIRTIPAFPGYRESYSKIAQKRAMHSLPLSFAISPLSFSFSLQGAEMHSKYFAGGIVRELYGVLRAHC